MAAAAATLIAILGIMMPLRFVLPNPKPLPNQTLRFELQRCGIVARGALAVELVPGCKPKHDDGCVWERAQA
jgi:hypothetical protein